MCSDQSSWWFQRYPQARVELILDLLPTPRYQCILPSRYHATHKLRHVRTRVYLGSHQAHQPLREPASRASVEDNFFFFFWFGNSSWQGKKTLNPKKHLQNKYLFDATDKIKFRKTSSSLLVSKKKNNIWKKKPRVEILFKLIVQLMFDLFMKIIFVDAFVLPAWVFERTQTKKIKLFVFIWRWVMFIRKVSIHERERERENVYVWMREG